MKDDKKTILYLKIKSIIIFSVIIVKYREMLNFRKKSGMLRNAYKKDFTMNGNIHEQLMKSAKNEKYLSL